MLAAEPINVADFHFQRPIGVLGQPLGSPLVISGVKEDRMGMNPLVVEEIGGVRLAKTVMIEIQGAPLKTGVRYRLEGFEGGIFSGPTQPGAQQVFGYRPFFVVTKVIEARALEARLRTQPDGSIYAAVNQ
jgi:hypothetical protein